MSILETVRRICREEADKFLPGATVVAPLAVWDADNKFMGVQIKAPRRMGAQDCEVTAGFVLSPIELRTQELIRVKANAAVACMIRDIQVSIRSVSPAAAEPTIQFTDVLTETPEAIKYSRRIVGGF